MVMMMIKTLSLRIGVEYNWCAHRQIWNLDFSNFFYGGSVWNQNHISMISMITMETDLKTMVLVTVILSYLRRNTHIDKNR